jgi:glutamyl-tRNA synthetase
MGIKGDTISHTSDYFDEIYDLAIKMIETGKAYTDNTEQAQVRWSSILLLPERC